MRVWLISVLLTHTRLYIEPVVCYSILTPKTIQLNPDSARIFNILAGEKCSSSNFKINTQTGDNKPQYLKLLKWGNPEQVLPFTGARDKIKTLYPWKLKNRQKDLTRLCKAVPQLKKG